LMSRDGLLDWMPQQSLESGIQQQAFLQQCLNLFAC
jgi:hypothetical protein